MFTEIKLRLSKVSETQINLRMSLTPTNKINGGGVSNDLKKKQYKINLTLWWERRVRV